MSQSQQKQQEQHQRTQQEVQTNKECKNRKRRNRRKRSEGSGPAVKCELKEEVLGAAGDSTQVPVSEKMEKKPLHTSMEQLQVVRKATTPIASRKAAGSIKLEGCGETKSN